MLRAASDSRPTLLLLTPDYPPAPGGIQLLMRRLAQHLERYSVTVVTRAVAVAPHATSSSPTETIRRPPHLPGGGPVSLAAFNMLATIEGLRRRPDVVLAGHVTVAPAAAILKRLTGAPTVAYLYADEVPHFERLSRMAIARADRVVAVSGHTADLARRYGATPDRLRVILPGVDLPPPPASRVGRSSPTIVTVARLVERY